MHRFISFFIVVIFFVWILPLGVFIKPSQEKEACNGQRAICLCSNLLAKAQSNSHGKPLIGNNGGGINKEQIPAGGTGGYFLIENSQKINFLAGSRFFEQSPNQYSLLVCKSIEHIPKV